MPAVQWVRKELALLKKMDELGIILDATHLCDDAFWQALIILAEPSGPVTTTAAR